MNLTELVAAISSRGYSFPQDITDPANPVVQALNTNYRKVCGAQRWPFLEKEDSSITTALGQGSYSLSSITDLRQLDAVRLQDPQGNTRDLDNVEPQEFKSYIAGDLDGDGTPQRWTQHAGNLLLWPVPDGPYTLLIDYICQVPDLAAADDVPVLPVTYHDVLVWGAILELAYRERDLLSQELGASYYQELYQQMKDEYLLRQRQTSSTVKRSGYWSTSVPGWSDVSW